MAESSSAPSENQEPTTHGNGSAASASGSQCDASVKTEQDQPMNGTAEETDKVQMSLNTLVNSNLLEDLEGAEDKALQLLEIVESTCQELQSSLTDSREHYATNGGENSSGTSAAAHQKKLRQLGAQYTFVVGQLGQTIQDSIDSLDPMLAKRLCEYQSKIEETKKGLQKLYDDAKEKNKQGTQGTAS
eukprot:gb/GECG01012135.1/.p1 GENE.gb/GECG01012135.1/~~gb/GECG01012135.1/.p1  ORF type:complete len:188 (+),score=42.69 gb/GECG01012135.1/:1-564(+)